MCQHIIEYTVLNENIHDTPARTQVTLEVLVSGEFSRKGLMVLLNDLCARIQVREDFVYHQHPTHILIYAYTSEASPGLDEWVAMLAKSYADKEPRISIISKRQLSQ